MEKTLSHITALPVKGMSCSNCALSVESYLKSQGLKSVAVDLGGEEVTFEEVLADQIPELVKGIKRLGFEVPVESSTSKNIFSLETKCWVSVVFTIPLILHMFIPWHVLHNPWIQLILATPVFLIGMEHFGKKAIASLRAGIPNMDVLISLGAIAAFSYSLYGTLMAKGPDFLFYETAASIITIVLIGNILEHRSVQKTTSAIRALSSLSPSKAHRWLNWGESNDIEEIEVGELRKGDIIQIRSGDRIPLDGELVEGSGLVDESMISGESEVIEKQMGEILIGGTLLVDGLVSMRITKLGDETVLSQIIQLVKRAQADKPDAQLLADRISKFFVPAVIFIALITFIFSAYIFNLSIQQSLIHAVAVLVISCPCAMGLATPTAVVVGIGRASRNGILVKGGKTLETFSNIQRVVFDKTGTLTTGEYSLKELKGSPDCLMQYKEVLNKMAMASSHPKSAFLLKQLGQGISPNEWELEIWEERGKGMIATDQEGNKYKLGSHRFLKEETSSPDDLYFLVNDELICSFLLEDSIVEGARETIDFLHSRGIETVLLSGDKKDNCLTTGQQLGIKTILYEQLPADKLRFIEDFIEKGPTAMVGDGINDAPAMSRANLAISVSGATEIAQQAADIILLKDGVKSIPELFRIGQHTVMTIRQNLFWAFFYNVLAIPFAALGFLSPMIAAFTMAISDVIVIGNSLRLRAKKLS